MKKKVKKEKKKIDKELLNLIIISLFLFVFGLIIFHNNTFIYSFVLGCTPYGYSLLEFLSEDKFKMFGKIDFIVSFLVRSVLGLFIGVIAFPIKIGFSIMDEK